MLEEQIDELKTICTRLQVEIDSLKQTKLACAKKGNIGRNNKISKQAKKELAEMILYLNLEQKKQLREIIKDYLVIYKDGIFEFNIDGLPDHIFKRLEDYTRSCLRQNGTRIKLQTRVRVI